MPQQWQERSPRRFICENNRPGRLQFTAAFPIYGASRLAHRTPLAALVTHLNRQGLDHEEFESLMHEFGHVLHHVLSHTDYAPQSGANVMSDFVEKFMGTEPSCVGRLVD